MHSGQLGNKTFMLPKFACRRKLILLVREMAGFIATTFLLGEIPAGMTISFTWQLCRPLARRLRQGNYQL